MIVEGFTCAFAGQIANQNVLLRRRQIKSSPLHPGARRPSWTFVQDIHDLVGSGIDDGDVVINVDVPVVPVLGHDADRCGRQHRESEIARYPGSHANVDIDVRPLRPLIAALRLLTSPSMVPSTCRSPWLSTEPTIFMSALITEGDTVLGCSLRSAAVEVFADFENMAFLLEKGQASSVRRPAAHRRRS